MAMLLGLKAILDQNEVPYTHHVHPSAYTARDVAAAEKLPPREVAKVVVFFGDNGFGMAVLPADFFVDLSELKAALDLSRVRLATEKEIAELFLDCELGAMPPFGSLFGLPVFLDSCVARQDTIAFNAGTHRDVVQMKYADFDRLVQPRVVHFARYSLA